MSPEADDPHANQKEHSRPIAGIYDESTCGVEAIAGVAFDHL